MPAKKKVKSQYDTAKAVWFETAPKKRTAANLKVFLMARGIDLSKSTLDRWTKDWRKAPAGESAPVPRIVKALGIVEKPKKPEPPADMAEIPQVLQDVLSPRLLELSDKKGLDRVVDVVRKVSDAIGDKAKEIVEAMLDTESETETVTGADGQEKTRKVIQKGQVARTAVAAIRELAGAMHTVASSRALQAAAHRDFGQGDLALAMAEKARAEAAEIEQRNRGAGARTINAEPDAPGQDDEAAALEAIRAEAK